MAVTTTTQVGPHAQDYYTRVTLERLKPYLAHALFATERPCPVKKGDTPYWRRYRKLSKITRPILEGVRIQAQQAGYDEVSGKIYLYGDVLEITEEVDLFNEDPVLTEFAELLGDQEGESLDSVYAGVFNAGTQVRFAGGVDDRDEVITSISVADLRFVHRTMKNNNVPYWKSKPIKGTNVYGSRSIPASYFALTHPNVVEDLRNLTGWVDVQDYSNQVEAVENEVGALPRANIRFVESTNAMIFPGEGGDPASNELDYSVGGNADALDVYTILVFGPDAVGVTPLKGHAHKTIVHPYGHGDDPMELIMTMAWKARTGAVITDDLRLYRIEVGVTSFVE